MSEEVKNEIFDEEPMSSKYSDSGSETGKLEIVEDEEEVIGDGDDGELVNTADADGLEKEEEEENTKKEDMNILEKLSADLNIENDVQHENDDDTTASTSIQQKPPSPPKNGKNVVKVFDWADYLDKTESVPAPDNFFFQNPTPPVNLFEEGKKLEMPDPRGSGGLCLATIEAVYGIWLLLRLNGCDDTNDQWVICDDRDIHAIGYAAKHHGDLQPPIGYRHSLAKFRQFLEQQLCTEDIAASEHWFNSIPKEFRPKKNLFEEGMKLEAVDFKNFTGSLFPATIVRITGDELEINFDGYSHGYNMTVRFDSRCLFPVGWGAKASLPVQLPPKPKGKIKKLAPRPSPVPPNPPSPSKVKSTAKTKAKVPETDIADLSHISRKGKGAKLDELIGKLVDKTSETSTKRPKKRESTPDVSTVAKKKPKHDSGAARKSLAPPEYRKQKSVSPVLHIPDTGSAVPTASSGARARKSFVSKASKRVDSPASDHSSVSRDRDSSPLQTTTASHVTPADIVLANDSASPESLKTAVYVHRGCACGPWIDPEKLRSIAAGRVGPGNVNHVVREAIQTIINCALDTRTVFQKVEPGPSRIMSVTADINGRTTVRSLPSFKDVRLAWSYITSYLDKLGACRQLLSKADRPCPQCSPPAEVAEAKKRAKRARKTSSGSSDGGGSTITERDGSSHTVSPGDLTEWSINDVAEAFESLGDPSIPAAFRNADIDGKALLLLSPEHIIKHMNIRLGPALKISEHIERLKSGRFDPE